MDNPDALVEFADACPGKGEYIAVVHHSSKGGELFMRSFNYSRKDPRIKAEAEVLQEITRRLSARYRPYVISISVVKRCLHPKSQTVSRLHRTPYFERLFSKVIEHPLTHRHEHLDGAPDILLPYTLEELRWLPVNRVLSTDFKPGQGTRARISLRGVEQLVDIDELLAA